MTDIKVRNKIATFLYCELDCNSGRLNIDGVQQKLEPMVHQFLVLLIEHQGDLVSKQQVFDTLWPNKEPSDVALRALVKKAREALKDNAKNPLYIKTVPTKGYLLIPSVTLVSTAAKSWVTLHATSLAMVGILVTVFVLSGIWYFFTSTTPSENVTSTSIKKSIISVIQRNEVSTHIVNKGLKNIWVDSFSSREGSVIFVEDIVSGLRQKMVFSAKLQPKLWFSQKSQHLVATRYDKKAFFVIPLGSGRNAPVIKQYSGALPEQSQILAVTGSGEELVIRIGEQQKFGLFTLTSGSVVKEPDLPPAYMNIIKQLGLMQLSSSKDSTQDDQKQQDAVVSIWPSPTSSGLVVNIVNAQYSKLFYYKSDEAAEPTNLLDAGSLIRSGVWNTNGNRFSYMNTDGGLVAFQRQDGRLTSFVTNGEPINQLVADCGVNCFIIANSQGVPKLSEMKIAFDTAIESNGQEIDSTSRPVQTISSNTIQRNEYLPQYTQQGLYFISQQKQVSSIVLKDNLNAESTLYTFPEPVNVKELVVDASDNYVAGIANERIFLLDLGTTEIRYLPVNFVRVSHINFDNDKLSGSSMNDVNNTVLQFYGEKSSANIDARHPNGLYEYLVDTQRVSLIKARIMAEQDIELIDNTDKGDIRYKGVFTLYNYGVATVSFNSAKDMISIKVSPDCMNCWQVKGNYLYQVRPSTNAALTAKMVKTSLLTGEQSEHDVFVNNAQRHFSLHPSLAKMAMSTRQSLQTQLTQIEGLTQVY